MRRLVGMLVAAVVAAAGIPLLAASPAEATGYRFWSSWHGNGAGWDFSGVGADTWRPKDGAVEGWRFAVSATTVSSPRPRADASTVWALPQCRDVRAGAGEVRMAVVIDFGDASDYADDQRPPADPVRVWCGVLPTRSTGMDLLNVASDGALRTNGGMVCGISGFPTRGCGEAVQETTGTPTARATSEPPRAKPTRRPSQQPTQRVRPSPSTQPRSTTPATAPTAPRSATTTAPVGPSADSPLVPTGSPASGPDGADAGSPAPVVGLPVAASGTTGGAGTPWPALLVAGLLAALAAGTYLRRRRR